MAKKKETSFDFEEHERQLAERYRRLARYDSFDKLVDLALDGVISMADAKSAWEAEEIDYGTVATE